ncbi:YjbF family lipoprotein [Sulfitobacter sp. S190]|uniref:YjbF family lipoprotein n=1 Tax=Sulfitobacter sp. S190 TaxID=2867022 RepID=UPI0021A8D71D|nr:YjbF family lipoprotein [Sulfitobacter sp. S190]UWR22569.1 YjbF family lipoprotein [Sulfitobacter sp. S190]
MSLARRLWAVSLASVLLLAACSSESGDDVNLTALTVDALRGAVGSRGDAPAPPVVVTPQMLAETKVAALQVNPEMRGGSDFLKRVAVRNDSALGQIEIWNSSDNAQIFLRNGVVAATRGVGRDIVSADVSLSVRAVQNRSNLQGIKRLNVSDGDLTTTEYVFECVVRNQGVESIRVVNQVFSATHLRETCVSDRADARQVVNDYWVQGTTGLVRKSRQWMGPLSGYFEIVLLKN